MQRHLQLRIEAQGRYLQSVLEKAQETLAGYNSSVGIETAKAELSQLVSMVNPQCPSSSLSGLTETGGLSLQNSRKRSMRYMDCSMDSSLTSSESSGRKGEKLENGDIHGHNRTSVLLPFLETDPTEGDLFKTGSNNWLEGRKRSRSTISDDNSVDQPSAKTSSTHKEKPDIQLRGIRLSEELDLNNQFQSEMDLGCRELDLNC